MSGDEPAFALAVAAQAARKLKAQRAGAQSAWFGLGMLGVIGWSVAVPTVLGTLLGVWCDQRHAGSHSWTLALLVAGLVLGCWNAGYWVARQNAAIHQDTAGAQAAPEQGHAAGAGNVTAAEHGGAAGHGATGHGATAVSTAGPGGGTEGSAAGAGKPDP